jgi:HAD superfamily hydrolase (TIGR01457 family)
MIKSILIDMDGTLFRGETAIPGAEKTLERLRVMGLKLFFLTNANNKTRAQLVAKLKKMKLMADENEIYSSAYATAIFIKENHPTKTVFCVSTGGIQDELSAKGIKVAEDDSAGIVAVGLDQTFNYKKLTIAFRAISKGALFIATNEDAAFPVEDGSLPGAGAMVGAIERSTGVKPILIGKPNKYGIELLLKNNNLKHSEVLIIGDRLETDIMCGKNNGLKSVLVLTGVAKKDDLKKIKKEEKPDYVLDSINELPDLLTSF